MCPANEVDRCVLVVDVDVDVDVDAGRDVSVDVSLVLAGTDVSVDIDVGFGVNRLVLPGVKETLLHENPLLGWEPPVGMPEDGSLPDDQGDDIVVWFVPDVLEIRNRDELVV